MARKIPGEFVPLDLNLPRDIKIRKAGPDAELLYIRGLIYLKQCDTDGFIPEFDLPVLSAGCKSVPASAKKLVAAGLWRSAIRDGVDGWECTAWLKWNLSEAEKDAMREERKIGALTTNHGKGQHVGSPHPECPKCQEGAPSERPRLAAL